MNNVFIRWQIMFISRGLTAIFIFALFACGDPPQEQSEKTPPVVRRKPVNTDNGDNAVVVEDDFDKRPNSDDVKTQLLWTGKDVTLKYVDFKSKNLFVAFNAALKDGVTNDKNSVGNHEPYFRKKKLSALFVINHDNHWYQTEEMRELFPIMKNIISQYKNVVGYGGSLGGFGALAFSKELDFDKVLVFGPQVDVDAWPYSARHKARLGFKNLFTVKDGLSPRAEYFLFYSMTHSHDVNAIEVTLHNYFVENGAKKIHNYPLPLRVHAILAPLAKARLLDGINMAAMRGDAKELDKMFKPGGEGFNILKKMNQ